jgi:hypothetical protein
MRRGALMVKERNLQYEFISLDIKVAEQKRLPHAHLSFG